MLYTGRYHSVNNWFKARRSPRWALMMSCRSVFTICRYGCFNKNHGKDARGRQKVLWRRIFLSPGEFSEHQRFAKEVTQKPEWFRIKTRTFIVAISSLFSIPRPHFIRAGQAFSLSPPTTRPAIPGQGDAGDGFHPLLSDEGRLQRMRVVHRWRGGSALRTILPDG